MKRQRSAGVCFPVCSPRISEDRRPSALGAHLFRILVAAWALWMALIPSSSDAAELDTLVEIFQDAVEAWEDEAPFIVILQGTAKPKGVS